MSDLTIISRDSPGDRVRVLADDGESGINPAGCFARSFWWDTYWLSGRLDNPSTINL
jgi:hypothetical protein